MDDGRRYEREQVVFVAPHNAGVEMRNAQAAAPDCEGRAVMVSSITE